MDDLQVISTDHGPFCMKEPRSSASTTSQKSEWGARRLKTACINHNGGVLNRISLNRFVELTSTAAAKMLACFQRRERCGGLDADIVILRCYKEQTLSLKTSHMTIDYNTYEEKRSKAS